MALALVGEVLPDVEQELVALAERANASHLHAMNAAQVAFEQAVAAGAALIRARELLPTGEWTAWLDRNFRASAWTANFYMRCAKNCDEVRAHFRGQPTLTGARYFLENRTAVRGIGAMASVETQERAANLAAEGVPFSEIAKQLGISRNTAKRYANPEYRQRLQARYVDRELTRTPGKRAPVGPAVLSKRMKDVGASYRRKDYPQLARDLDAVAEAASAWRDQLLCAQQ